MRKQLFGLSFGFAAIIAAADMAQAQQTSRCAARDVVLDRLATGYGAGQSQ